MSGVTGAVVGAAVVGGSMYSANQQNKAAKRAAEQQQAGIKEAQQYSQVAADVAVETLQPLVDRGVAAEQAFRPTLAQYGQVGQAGVKQLQQQGGDLNVNQFLDPSMKFAMEQGTQAIERSAAARGGLLSGAALKDLAQFSTDLASQNYNNAVTQAMNDRAQRSSIAGQQIDLGNTALQYGIDKESTGINALGQQSNIASMQGGNMANLAMTSGNVAARGTASQTSVLGAGLSAGGGLGMSFMNAPSNSVMGGMASSFFSDERLKYGVDDITDEEVDEFLSALAPKSYEYTEEAIDKGAPTGRKSGVMAQDMQKSKLGKQLVKETPEGDLKVDSNMALSALMAAGANANKRLKALENKSKGKK